VEATNWFQVARLLFEKPNLLLNFVLVIDTFVSFNISQPYLYYHYHYYYYYYDYYYYNNYYYHHHHYYYCIYSRD